MILSILIPTLDERQTPFEHIFNKLSHQIDDLTLGRQIEILALRDNREHSLGNKRNRLIEQAQGEFVVFVDDDDDVSTNYVRLITEAIQAHPAIDCIGIQGTILFNGEHPRRFIHSLQYKEYFCQRGVYYRPPNHLNPIRRAIALRYHFADISYSEDMDWALRLCRDRALSTEVILDEPIYTYYSRRSWRYQQFIDWSTPVRHKLGLQWANRLRVQRWLKARLGRIG
jgi:glycosyltransferase involved in cell wall biosynthesis